MPSVPDGLLPPQAHHDFCDHDTLSDTQLVHDFSRGYVYENISGVGQNTNFFSGRAPGNALEEITLRNVSLTIDRWANWNYSHPDHDYRPTSCAFQI